MRLCVSGYTTAPRPGLPRAAGHKDKRKQEELTGDRDKLEKFAREEYLMKRENEDIFIIINE